MIIACNCDLIPWVTDANIIDDRTLRLTRKIKLPKASTRYNYFPQYDTINDFVR